MPKQKQGESVSQFAIRTAWELGHFWSPSNPEGHTLSQSDLASLTVSDDVVVKALISLSKSSVGADGKIREFQGPTSPEMKSILEESRCPVPDHAPPPGVDFQFEDPALQEICLKMQRDVAEAVGSGSWPQCHGVGNFHCAAIKVNSAGIGSFLKPLFNTVLKNVRDAYAKIGLLFRFISMDGVDLLTGQPFSGNINSDMSFVQTSSGYIGIAIVGQNESCSSKIWNRYLATYRGGQSDSEIVTQWSSLVRHELGHNCGLQHTSGGTMNPSIVNGLPLDWISTDPSTSKLKSLFGGVPVPIPGGDPPVPPIPPDDLEKRIHRLEVAVATNMAVADFKINGLEARVKALEEA